MGLDQHIIMAHNKKEVDNDNFWTNCIDASGMIDFEYDRPAFLWYNRKNLGLQNEMATDNGEILQIDDNTLEKILQYLTHNPDYFDSFNSVPDLCKIIYNYQLIRNNGFALFYMGDW